LLHVVSTQQADNCWCMVTVSVLRLQGEHIKPGVIIIG